MIAYKGFNKGLICRGYQFSKGENITEEANCAKNGFHSAENPLDCITYYGNIKDSIYCIVEVTGDMDEDDRDSKIASTELRIIKQLTLEELFLHALAFMVDHPKRTWSNHVSKDQATARYGYAVVRGSDPVARGKLGDILAFAKECKDSPEIEQVALARVDGKDILPDVWYGIDLTERQVECLE